METVRECSYTRNNEFKLFRMKPAEILDFNPYVISVYFKKFDAAFSYYKNFYLPKLEDNVKVEIKYDKFNSRGNKFDIVLTSPPYGDSRTTVAYGQFSAKNVKLPTDQFIAEQFEENGFNHLVTYERALSNKSMPQKNSPTNEKGKTVNTMLSEYIVVCEKIAQ